MKNVILFELNEVPLRIIRYFVSQKPNSTLARVLPQSRLYQTFADDKILSPWITWPSVHRGVNDHKHHIHNFGQPLAEIDKEFPTIWQRLTAKGLRVGVFGSLHTYPLPANTDGYDFFVPDVFAAGAECFPQNIESFQRFNLAMSRASARNVSTSVPWKEALNFLYSLPDLGIRPSTVLDIGHQLVSEKVNHAKTTRRRTYQVVLAFDIFMKQLTLHRPNFCTFFTNHVASSMHRYWAAVFPDDYAVFNHQPSWVNTYRDEVMFAMGKFDDMLRRLAAFVDANDGFELWIATSMGQAATSAEPCESELFVKDDAKFAKFFSLTEWERRPAMVPDFGLLVSSGEASAFAENLKQFFIGGRPIGFKRSENFFSIGLGHLNQRGKRALYRGAEVEFSDVGLENQIIEDHTGSTAYHIPQGCLLIYGSGYKEGTQIASVDIHQGILSNYGLSNSSRL